VVYLLSAFVYQEAWQSLDASVLTKYLFYRFLALHRKREKEKVNRIFDALLYLEMLMHFERSSRFY
jgi:hypothetical protein